MAIVDDGIAGLTAAHLREDKSALSVQGQHSEEILAELGYSTDEIFAFEARGIVAIVAQSKAAHRRRSETPDVR